MSEENVLEGITVLEKRIAELERRYESPLRWKKIPVGSDGFVTLVDSMGTDQSVVQAARVSYGQDQRDMTPEERADDRALLRYLMRHRHSTPFEMVEIKVLVRVPMDTWRQWIRHRTANVNEYSTRYQPAIDSMATTDEWRLQSSNNKQGSSGLLGSDWKEGMDSELRQKLYGHVTTPGEYLSAREQNFHNHATEVYQERLKFGVAREQARKDLPLSNYTEAYWKCDLHNVLHFLSLRMDSHAQLEIREFANALYSIVKQLFPLCCEAFEDYRLNAISLSALDIELCNQLCGQAVRIKGFLLESPNINWPEGWKPKWQEGVLKAHRERDESLAKLVRLGVIYDD